MSMTMQGQQDQGTPRRNSWVSRHKVVTLVLAVIVAAVKAGAVLCNIY